MAWEKKRLIPDFHPRFREPLAVFEFLTAGNGWQIVDEIAQQAKNSHNAVAYEDVCNCAIAAYTGLLAKQTKALSLLKSRSKESVDLERACKRTANQIRLWREHWAEFAAEVKPQDPPEEKSNESQPEPSQGG